MIAVASAGRTPRLASAAAIGWSNADSSSAIASGMNTTRSRPMTISTTYAASAIAMIRQAQAAAARMPGGTTAASIERTLARRPSWRRACSHCARSARLPRPRCP